MIFRNCPFFPHHLTPPPKNGFWGAQTDTKNLLIVLKPLHIGHWRYPESLNTFKIFDPNPLVAWSWSASAVLGKVGNWKQICYIISFGPTGRYDTFVLVGSEWKYVRLLLCTLHLNEVLWHGAAGCIPLPSTQLQLQHTHLRVRCPGQCTELCCRSLFSRLARRHCPAAQQPRLLPSVERNFIFPFDCSHHN